MKELSIEQKAKAYDKAIAYAKILLKTIGNATLGNLVLKNEFENMFPELKESEGERIRKDIISYLKSSTAVSPKTWIDWLEKQGEQKPAENSEKASEYATEEKDMTEYNKGFECGKQRVLKYPEDFGLCKKPDDKVEPKFKVGDKIISTISNIHYYIVKVRDEYYLTDVGCIIMFNAQDNFELVEQKSNNKIEPSAQNKSWSEEDENIRLRLIDYLYGKSRLTKDREDGISWLKSLKDSVQPQPKQKWSEEDEKEVAVLEAYIRSKDWSDRHIDRALGIVDELVKKLKSLKDRYTWMPSAEHYELEEFAKIVRCNLTGISKAVQELFEAKYLQLTGNKMYGGFKD